MEKKRQLRLVTLSMPDFVRQIETCVQFGYPVLLQARPASAAASP